MLHGVTTFNLCTSSSSPPWPLSAFLFSHEAIPPSKSLLSASRSPVLKRQHPRPPLHAWDRLFWTILHRLWHHWFDVLLIVKPATVIAWHRAGFRLYWRWRS